MGPGWGILFPRGGYFSLGNNNPGGHIFLGYNVRGDTYSRGTLIPPTPAVMDLKFNPLVVIS